MNLSSGATIGHVTDLPFTSRGFAANNLLYGLYYDDQMSPARWRPALLSAETGQLVKPFDLPPTVKVAEVIDERTVIYAESNNDIENLWWRPLEGGTPKQLTKFDSERIFSFVRSRDGKQFAVVRGQPQPTLF